MIKVTLAFGFPGLRVRTKKKKGRTSEEEGKNEEEENTNEEEEENKGPSGLLASVGAATRNHICQTLTMLALNHCEALRPYLESSRANSYPWSPFPPRRARPGPGPHNHHRVPVLKTCTFDPVQVALLRIPLSNTQDLAICVSSKVHHCSGGGGVQRENCQKVAKS